jgi:hypothetical protein
MSELVYKDEVFQLVGFCMEIHRELGKGHDEIVYKDAFVVELSRAEGCFMRHEFHQFTRMDLMWFVAIRVIRVPNLWQLV